MDILTRSSFLAEDLGPQLLVVTLCFFGLSFLVVASRLYTRVFVAKRFRLDDYLMMTALFFAAGSTGSLIASIKHGLGKHAITLRPTEKAQALKWLFATQIVSVTSYYFLKLSIAGLLLRLTTKRGYLCMVYGITILLTIAQVFDYIFIFAKCAPVAKQWNTDVNGECWNEGSVLVWKLIEDTIDILTDWMFVVLPLVLLWDTFLNPRKLVSILLLMLFGAFAAGIAIFNTVRLATNLSSADSTFASVELIEWSLIELNIGIIISSIPSLRPLFHYFDDNPATKIISLPLEFPQPFSTNPKPNPKPNPTFTWPYKTERDVDLERNVTRKFRLKPLPAPTGPKNEEGTFRASTQEFLLGILPTTASGMVRFGRNGGLRAPDSDNDAWG